VISIRETINAKKSVVWDAWITPQHIVNWYFASEDWCCPSANVECKIGGSFSIRMEAKDNSFGFDFYGQFTAVNFHKSLGYTLGDGRKVSVEFEGLNDQTTIVWHFEPETQNPESLQRQGWQAILTHFKQYVERSTVESLVI
jgi:uncharacterized protein YndB with AHSA1/START domain